MSDENISYEQIWYSTTPSHKENLQLCTGSTSCLETPKIGKALAWRACNIDSLAVSHPLSHPLSLSLSSSLSAAAVEGRLAHE